MMKSNYGVITLALIAMFCFVEIQSAQPMQSQTPVASASSSSGAAAQPQAVQPPPEIEFYQPFIKELSEESKASVTALPYGWDFNSTVASNLQRLPDQATRMQAVRTYFGIASCSLPNFRIDAPEFKNWDRVRLKAYDYASSLPTTTFASSTATAAQFARPMQLQTSVASASSSSGSAAAAAPPQAMRLPLNMDNYEFWVKALSDEKKAVMQPYAWNFDSSVESNIQLLPDQATRMRAVSIYFGLVYHYILDNPRMETQEFKDWHHAQLLMHDYANSLPIIATFPYSTTASAYSKGGSTATATQQPQPQSLSGAGAGKQEKTTTEYASGAAGDRRKAPTGPAVVSAHSQPTTATAAQASHSSTSSSSSSGLTACEPRGKKVRTEAAATLPEASGSN